METQEIRKAEEGALNDLIKINNDRIIGYEKAVEATTDDDLKIYFNELGTQSKNFKSELESQMNHLGGTVVGGTTLPGKFYHAWMDLKSTFTGKNRHSILEDCEFGEDAAKKSYQTAINDADLNWDHKIIAKLEIQLNKIKEVHEKMKDLRDHSK